MSDAEALKSYTGARAWPASVKILCKLHFNKKLNIK